MLVLLLLIALIGVPANGADAIARGDATAAHRGVYEVVLEASPEHGNPYFDVELRVEFTRPDGRTATVDGFFDGGQTFRARAYCDTMGEWRWRSVSNDPGLNGKSGAFRVAASSLKGKLRKHPDDPHQFAYDNGEWFLHIGDTGYRYVTATEPKWREYIDQADQMGATKIRTWFCQGRSDVQVLFGEDRRTLHLPYWQEIDRRIAYALEQHPSVQLKLIPYGEDTEEIRRYGTGDPAAKLIARYAQARFSAYPNIHWCLTNDREIVTDEPLTGRRVRASTIDRMGRDMAAREAWGTLLTNHQSRHKGYSFVDADWSDITTLEDMDQVTGKLLLAYRARSSDPVVNDEDRYANYRFPKHERYYFRRLMWASLLSGGHATYGGLRTYEAYDSGLRGVQGYYDAVREGKLLHGADDFQYIHAFFRDTGLTLVGMEPADDLVGADPKRWKCAGNGKVYIIYLANPFGDTPETDGESTRVPNVTLALPGEYEARWFDPATGEWSAGVWTRGQRTVSAPGRGDWVLLLQRK